MANTLQEYVDKEYGVVIDERIQPESVRPRDLIRWANQCIVAKNNEIAALNRRLADASTNIKTVSGNLKIEL